MSSSLATNMSIDALEQEVEQYESRQEFPEELSQRIVALSGKIALKYGNKVTSTSVTNSNYTKSMNQSERLLGLLIRVTNILTTNVDKYISLNRLALAGSSAAVAPVATGASSSAAVAPVATGASSSATVAHTPFLATKPHSSVASVLKKRSTYRRSRSGRKTRKH